jgi:hypothetical protein
VGAADCLPEHIRRDSELPRAVATGLNLLWLNHSFRLSKNVSRDFDWLRARRAGNHLSSLRFRNLKRLLTTRTP